MIHILVTGANGFVGNQLSRVLLDSGYQVRAALRQQYTQDDFAVKDQVVVGNIDMSTQWEKAICDVNCVVHLAARVHLVNETTTDPLSEFRSVNVDGTVNLARQAVAAGVKRLIYVSSIKVNGEINKEGKSFREDDLPAPVDPYAISKFEAERALLDIAETTGIEVVIIRPVLVYGPRVKANFMRMMQWLDRGIPLPFGNIHNMRSLISLENLVDLIITCTGHPAASNNVFLASDGEDLSTTELLQRMGQALGKPPRLIPVPVTILEIMAMLVGRQKLVRRLCGSLQVDISKGRDLLNWEPIVTMEESLRKTAEAYLEEKAKR